MSLVSGLNWAWMRLSQRERWAFELATRDVAQVQVDLLREIIVANSATEFGRLYNYPKINSAQEFRDRVPLGDYESFRPWIHRVARGEPNVLTHEPVPLLQPTSGTTSAEKLIPFTPALRAQFQRGISAWIGDLYSQRPAVRRGRAYWSISPSIGDSRSTSGGVRIGFDNDAEYLNRLGRLFMRQLLAVPPDVAALRHLNDFRRATLLHLLSASDLSLISIWNPSFLTVLLSYLNDHWERLCDGLRREMRNTRRAEEVESIFRTTSSTADRTQLLWPNLALVSCWADAAAAMPLAELQAALPHAEIQPKGLLATEGFVSLPMCDESAAVLAVRSHFFEFIQQGSSATRLAHELDIGARYSVVITTAGGLSRYQLHDEIEVIGRHNECPAMRFVGKTDSTSDIVGEKLAEPFVRQEISAACQSIGIESLFAILVPAESKPPRYRLFVQANGLCPLERLADELDQRLKANLYYHHAVEFGQLGPIEVALLRADSNPHQLYNDAMTARGQRLGNIKPMALDRWQGWATIFAPCVIAHAEATRRNTATHSSSRAAAPLPHR